MTLQSPVRRHPVIWFAALSIVPCPGGRGRSTSLGLIPVPVASFGPFLAALVVLAVTEGKPGIVGLLRRMGRWRVGVGWYYVALALPVALSAVAVMINIALGAQADLSMAAIDWLGILAGVRHGAPHSPGSAGHGRNRDGEGMRCPACSQGVQPCAPP